MAEGGPQGANRLPFASPTEERQGCLSVLLDESSHVAPSSRAADQEVKTDCLKHNSEEQFSSGEEAILPPRTLGNV